MHSGGPGPRLPAPGRRTRATSMRAPAVHRQTRPGLHRLCTVFANGTTKLSAMRARLVVPALLAGLTLTAAASAAPERPSAAKVTAAGVDGDKLGASFATLRKAHKISKAVR